MTRRLSLLAVVLFSAVALCLGLARTARAAPQAHILRIDPRAGITNGKPTLTTVVDVVQFKPLSDVLAPCANQPNSLSCYSTQVEKPGALWDVFPFPEDGAHLLIKVAGSDVEAKFLDKTQWGKAQGQPDIGTAWLVAVDASSGMGGRFNDARAVAHEFIEAMQANDLLDLMFFDDAQIVKDTHWMTYGQRPALATALNDFRSTTPSHGRDRPLFKQIKEITQNGFGSLGNYGSPDQIPLHQAMVVLSNGAGRGDAESASPNADIFHQYLDGGRFPAENTALPKTPLPVISILLPNAAGGNITEMAYHNNEIQFMQALSNPEIGGYFDVVNQGEGAAKGKTILARVRDRFNAMWLVHWELACVNPSLQQTFTLSFSSHPLIAPDGTFKDVPLGIDPSQWPLDVNVKKTQDEAIANPVYPGGTVKVIGNFCWGGDKSRAEGFFLPPGWKPTSRDPRAMMQDLQTQHMVGMAVSADATSVTVSVPDDEKVVDGSGDSAVARLIIYDMTANRASATDEKMVLQLKAGRKPLSWGLIIPIAGLAVVIVLLVMVLLRGGGGRRRGGGGAPPPPAPPGYGAPPTYGAPPGPGGYGAPQPPGGGYGMQAEGMNLALANAGDAAGAGPGMFAPAAQAPYGMTAGQPPYAAPVQAPPPPPPPEVATPLSPAQDSLGGSGGGYGGGMGATVVQVRCPACGMNTMATPGQPSVCFSCGQPLPADLTKGGGGAAAPGFPTGAMAMQPLVPPPNPYGATAGIMAAQLRGPSGQFTVRAGSEVRVGRDPAQCPIFLSEPRVSGVHATLKLEGGQLLVRDETSNNGTWISGARLAPGAWTPVPQGAPLRFGPVEFEVQLDQG